MPLIFHVVTRAAATAAGAQPVRQNATGHGRCAFVTAADTAEHPVNNKGVPSTQAVKAPACAGAVAWGMLLPFAGRRGGRC